jgi:hypothetical protein
LNPNPRHWQFWHRGASQCRALIHTFAFWKATSLDANGPASVFIDIIGMPLTPLSYAGVARRMAHRSYWLGAAAAPYYSNPYAYPMGHRTRTRCLNRTRNPITRTEPWGDRAGTDPPDKFFVLAIGLRSALTAPTGTTAGACCCADDEADWRRKSQDKRRLQCAS